MTDKWLTIDQIADYLQVSNEKIYKPCQKGKMPASKVGRVNQRAQKNSREAESPEGAKIVFLEDLRKAPSLFKRLKHWLQCGDGPQRKFRDQIRKLEQELKTSQ